MPRQKSGPKPRPLAERFWASVEKQAGGCWIYGARAETYSRVKGDDGQLVSAHRYSYMTHKGEIPAGLFICHTCDVRGCVNPDHLYAGTHEQNTKDSVDRGLFKPKAGRRLPRPVKRAYKNQRCLCEADRKRLVAEYATGKFTQMELARRYRMSQGAVSATIRGWPGRKPDGGKKRQGHFRRKFPVELIQQIPSMYFDDNMTQTEIAMKYGIDQTYVSRIIKRSTVAPS